jgi:hypothetical protein
VMLLELPWEQQFIEKPPVFRRRGYVIASVSEKRTCGFLSFYYIIWKGGIFCVKRAKNKKLFGIVHFLLFILLR